MKRTLSLLLAAFVLALPAAAATLDTLTLVTKSERWSTVVPSGIRVEYTFNGVVAGQKLWTADREGVVMIHCSGDLRSTLRIPATIQFVRPGDEVRAPTWDGGKVSVTFWGYKR